MRVAIVGLGKLGSLHTKIYAALPNAEIVGICDTDINRLSELKCLFPNIALATTNYQELMKLKPDAISIATPTLLHFPIARFFLSHRVNCLVEKPLSNNLSNARILLNLAKKNRVVLMVGHVERFNPAFKRIREIAKKPKFIECDRLSPFPNRSLDISVVLDLMIHDLDIILSLVQSKVKRIDAVGVQVLSNTTDIANARISFQNGCIADISASRISRDSLRKIRIFLPKTYISVNYAKQEAEIFTKTDAGIVQQRLDIPKDEPLKEEIAAFLSESEKKDPDFSQTEAILDALRIALEIDRNIAKTHV